MPSVILATGCYDHAIRFWEVPSGFCYRTIQHTESQVNKLEISPNKLMIAAAGNPHIRLFELRTNNPQPVTVLSGHKSNVTSIGFQKEGKFLYSGGEDGTVKIWDLRTSSVQQDTEYAEGCNSVALHPNQEEIYCGYQNGSMMIWDLRANKQRETIITKENPLRSISIRSDGKLCAAVNNEGGCFVWQINENGALDLVKQFEAHKRYVLKCLFSPDAKLLATASADHTVRIWDTKEFKSRNVLSGHQKWVWDCVFSSDSTYLVTASSDNLSLLWDMGQGESIRHYKHNKAVSCVALNDSADAAKA
eukprot:TRINITY_DN5274_c0_g1_i1.p1 TRINITY_DN5274_c0_g1~~TRINITY_DN5274_c0_g1_i1.p1  ORF type:complete len:305 (-),score=40.55 TRINITY_DN5274_c0_g1_i1:27-941(-)